MINPTSTVTTPAPAELPPASTATSSAGASFADQLANAGETSPSTAAAPQNLFMQYFFSAVSASAAPAPAASTATTTESASPAPTGAAAPSTASNDATQATPAYTVSATPPYFTPAPDQYTTVTPTNGMSPFQADSMDSYMQKFIQQSVSDMYGFVSGTQGWANGGASAITDNFVSMVQQRITAYPSMGAGIDPVAMGTQYANVFMNVLSNVPVSQFGPTSFQGSVMDFLTQGGSPEPTVLNQSPTVMNATNV